MLGALGMLCAGRCPPPPASRKPGCDSRLGASEPALPPCACCGAQAYIAYRRVIENANVIMATYADDELGDTQVRGGAGPLGRGKNLFGLCFALYSALQKRRAGTGGVGRGRRD